MYRNGQIFNGTFLNNKRVGCGTHTDIDGTVERGHWREDKKNGLFQITYSNGAKFCVNFVNDKEDGQPHENDCLNSECF